MNIGAGEVHALRIDLNFRRDVISQAGVQLTISGAIFLPQPNEVWATAISYVPMARGFIYLVAIVGWFSRRVLAWRVSTRSTRCLD